MVPCIVIVLIVLVVGFYAKDLILMRSKPDLEPLYEQEKKKQEKKKKAEEDETDRVYETCQNLKFVYKGKSYSIQNGMVIGRGDSNVNRLNLCPLSGDSTIHRDFAKIKRIPLKDEYYLEPLSQMRKLRPIYVVENDERRQMNGPVTLKANQQFIFASKNYVVEIKEYDALEDACSLSSQTTTTKVMTPTN